jgi:hypothetical protein
MTTTTPIVNPLLSTLWAEATATANALATAKRDYDLCVSVARHAPKGWKGAPWHGSRTAQALARLEAARAAYDAALADLDSFAAILAEGPAA